MVVSPRTRTVVLIVVAVLAGIIWYASAMQQPPAPTTAAPAAGTPAGSPVFAPQGQLTPGFPKRLILDTGAAITGSYSINYSSSTNQYTAEWNSSSSMLDLYSAYKTYLPANGWPITNDITKYSTSRGLYASNATSVVSVAIIKEGSGSQVSVSYVTK